MSLQVNKHPCSFLIWLLQCVQLFRKTWCGRHRDSKYLRWLINKVKRLTHMWLWTEVKIFFFVMNSKLDSVHTYGSCFTDTGIKKQVNPPQKKKNNPETQKQERRNLTSIHGAYIGYSHIEHLCTVITPLQSSMTSKTSRALFLQFKYDSHKFGSYKVIPL